MKQKLLTLMTLLLCAVSGAWAADLVEKYQVANTGGSENGYLTTIAVDGTNAVFNSRRIQVAKDKTGTFTIATNSSVTSFKIKSITLKEYSSNKVGSLQVAGVDVPETDTDNNIYTYTAGSNETSVVFTLSASGGAAQISEIAITLTDGNEDDCESLVPDSGKGSSLACVSTLSPSLATVVGGSDDVKYNTSNSTKVIEIGSGKSLTISSTRAFKAIYFSYLSNIPTWTVPEGTTYTADSHCWTPANTTTTSVELTKSNSNTTRISNIHIVYQPSGPQDGVFTISKSSLEVGETAKILLNGNDNFSTYFTATTLWEPVATGPYVSLTSDGTVTAVKNTPEGYYFTFTANSKDTEKYNTTTNNSITVAVTAPKCATPVISPADGSTFGGYQSVTITCETGGAAIHYTTDGTTPTSSSATYSSPFNVTNTTTIKAIAVKADYDDSNVATAKLIKVNTAFDRSWDFGDWSDATKTGTIADATNWNQYEKADSKGLNFGDNGRSNVGSLSNNTLKYGSTNIEETNGLKFTSGAYGLGLIYNLPSATISEKDYTYHGSQYLWLYSSSSRIVIPDVLPGSTIGIGVESHNGGDARGVTLTGGDATQIAGSATSTTYQDVTWRIPTGGEVTITPSKGLHIYYITILKNSEIEPVSSFGWSTYITKSAASFAANTAYVVTEVDGSNIVTEAVTSVPANTPILLKGEGNKTITPLLSADDLATNLLSVSKGTANGTKIPYVLAKNGESAGFKKWTGDIAKLNGRVVLWLDSEIAARDFFDLDGEATGINKVVNNQVMDNQYYNLAGQRVAQPTKGLYIVNGKKVIIK